MFKTLPDGRYFVPTEYRTTILKLYHDDASSGGHDGQFRTYYKIKARFFWHQMKEEIIKYVRSCSVCQHIKFKYKPRVDKMIIPNQSQNPFEVVHIDFAELTKRSDLNLKTKSFVIIVDEFTRMVFAKAMKEDVRSLIHYLKQHPKLPFIKKIVSDCGTVFKSNALVRFAEERQIILVNTSPYHPPGNGLAERKIRDIKKFIECYPNFRGGWKAALEAAVKHENRSYNNAIGCSPNFKAYGKTTLLEADKTIGIKEQNIHDEMHKTAEKQKEYYEKMKFYYDKKHFEPQQNICEGSLILVQCGFKGKKLVVNGPYKVVGLMKTGGILKNIIYEDEKGNEKIAHITNVRLYHSRKNEESSSGDVNEL
ncbi:polymerase-like protein [Dinothrombium tinctorium]|uniref:RNA-directed DNA polymerase n=1 Tax=Dinothrombium tinctorium TaxID=1965070 RepID=A0A443QDB1_9ACAR|nr:polymerase-like protein [Dinothrombium tinctorium]